MMKVVLDTNVLVAATFWAGDSDRIMSLIEKKKIKLFLSKEIIDEYVEVLNYEDVKKKIKSKNLEVRRTIEKIAQNSSFVIINNKLQIIKEDPDDNKIIETAAEANVDFIVTNDKVLLKLKDYEDIKIVTPKEFLNIIKE